MYIYTPYICIHVIYTYVYNVYIYIYKFKHLSLKCYAYRLIDTCVSRKAVYEYVDTLDIYGCEASSDQGQG